MINKELQLLTEEIEKSRLMIEVESKRKDAINGKN
jgi:hypothetical protein